MYQEEQLLPISALQHYLFCKRRAALVFTEGQWADNRYTVEGTQLHERADDPKRSQRLSEVRIERAVGLCSYRWGLSGKADVIEFHRTDEADQFRIKIIEYKRGKPKRRLDRPFQVQLCAQALCVEDMLGYSVESAAIYYGLARQRLSVELDLELREQTAAAILQLHELIESRRTPLPIYKQRKCSACSLNNLCMPAAIRPVATAARYITRLINESGEL